uniref:Uncharacterized protein n=1 Tax=Salix viminalis TaxID=40686 RepID=A0A6N2KTI0_SALVM
MPKRLRDPRGLRRGGLSAAATAAFPRNLSANEFTAVQLVLYADRNNAEDQPPAKRRLFLCCC